MPEATDFEVAVYRSASLRSLHERELVLVSAGIEFQRSASPRSLVLWVAGPDAGRALAELAAYERETSGWATAAAPAPRVHDGWSGVLGCWCVLLGVALLQHHRVWSADWLAAGRASAGLIREGQAWRAVTALTLHSSASHLLANLVFCGLFGFFAGQIFGCGLAWACILAAGILGNLINGWIQPVDHSSIGASTAVFAALGLLSGWSWRRRAALREQRVRRWAPLVSGLILLALLGTGDERTDVIAHVTGFASGLLLGVVGAGLGPRWRVSWRSQGYLGAAALAVVAWSWWLALRR